MRYEGSYDHEQQDARQFAAWGVDFVKVDWCCTHPTHLADRNRGCPRSDPHDYGDTGQQELYQRWQVAFSKVDRPMVLSICEWGTGKPWLWAPAMGNMWRTTEDIVACRSCRKSWWGLGWEPILDQQAGLAKYAGPGHWNDPDMLIVGVKNLNERDARAHFSFWCLLAAPLIAGNDPRNMPPATHSILTNREAIAVDQDTLGVEGHRMLKTASTEVWIRPLTNRGQAVILFNRSGHARSVAFGLEGATGYKISDVWKHHELGFFSGRFHSPVPAHDVVFLTLKPD
jgi:alpha-galactosidase